MSGRADSSEDRAGARGARGEDAGSQERWRRFVWEPGDVQIVVPGKPGVFSGDGSPVLMTEESESSTEAGAAILEKRKLPVEQVVSGLGGTTLGDFWSWAYSDILSNRNRGVFAEFVVGHALDALERPREEWDAVDLRYRGKKIEVKSAAYWQSWPQKEMSKIIYGIGKRLAFDAESNTQATEPLYSADCYVFALYPQPDREKVDVLDIPAWRFYVVATSVLVEHVGDLKTLSIARLEKIVRKPCGIGELRGVIDAALGLAERD